MRNAYVLLFLTLYIHGVDASTDSTVTPETKGGSVVNSVVERIDASCVFTQSDRLFSRRTAYVESTYGYHADTYRTGYHGGIWQVHQENYNTTISQSSYLAGEISNISQAFNIQWLSTTWEDLRKPLYSGLAFRLYLTYVSGRGEIPWEIPDQANYWKTHYRPNNNASEFVSKAGHLEHGCNTTAGPDIALVLDSSGSIGAANFQLVRNFAANIVNEFMVSSDNTRVALINFGRTTVVEFHLNTYFDKQDVINHINTLQYLSGGTPTHIALDTLVDDVMTEDKGARPDRPRVAVVMTDGKSDNENATMQASDRAHAASITMLAVGVGTDLRVQELWAIASPPQCTNQFFPKDFNDMLGVVSSIKKKVCEAPTIVTPSFNGTYVGGVLPPGESHNCRINIPIEGATVKMHVWKGTGYFFVATDTYPSDAYYEAMMTATPPTSPAVMFIAHSTGQGRADIKYCNVKANDTTESNITVEVTPGDRDWCKHTPCENSGQCFDLGNDGYQCNCREGYTGPTCESTVNMCMSAPCYVMSTCEDLPGTYICHCDAGWNGTQCDNFLGYNCADRNPCTIDNILREEFLWPHADPDKYVQCDPLEPCQVIQCPIGTEWDWVTEECSFFPTSQQRGYNPKLFRMYPGAHGNDKPGSNQHRKTPHHDLMTSYRNILQEEMAIVEKRLAQEIVKIIHEES